MLGLNPLRPALRTAANSASLLRSFSATASRDFARMTIVGRMGVQPEVTTTGNGREITKYVVASSHGTRDNPQTSWFRVASFLPDGPARQHLLNVSKGSLVLVEGDASMNTFENQDGKKSSVLNIIQKNLQVLKRGQQQQSEGSEGSESEYQQ